MKVFSRDVSFLVLGVLLFGIASGNEITPVPTSASNLSTTTEFFWTNSQDVDSTGDTTTTILETFTKSLSEYSPNNPKILEALKSLSKFVS